jgi:hypothetical protein
MKPTTAFLIIVSVVCFLFVMCTNSNNESSAKQNFGGFANQVTWGEHLVTVSACHDCHSPKKFGPMGMQIDSAHMLAGHMSSPVPDVDKKDFQKKGYVVTGDLTAWVGPWGISYTANLTSDESGIGNWSEEQFIRALRFGKFKGMMEGRDLLPPMPWQMYRNMTDDEIKAIFAYLKSTKPVENVVPPPTPPVQ